MKQMNFVYLVYNEQTQGDKSQVFSQWIKKM